MEQSIVQKEASAPTCGVHCVWAAAGLRVWVYAGDISKARTDGIAVVESGSQESSPDITVQLVENQVVEFREARLRLFSQEGDQGLQDGEVYATRLHSSTPQYTWVFHAVNPSGHAQRTALYTKLCTNADTLRCSSLAIPLISAEKGSEALRSLCEGIVQYATHRTPTEQEQLSSCLQEIQVVVFQGSNSSIVVSELQLHFRRMCEVSKNGVPDAPCDESGSCSRQTKTQEHEADIRDSPEQSVSACTISAIDMGCTLSDSNFNSGEKNNESQTKTINSTDGEGDSENTAIQKDVEFDVGQILPMRVDAQACGSGDKNTNVQVVGTENTGQNSQTHQTLEEDKIRQNSSPDQTRGEDNICVICREDITDRKELDKCGHVFCRECIDASFEFYRPVCPQCNTAYGEIRGNQPSGEMSVNTSEPPGVPGYEKYGIITINYSFPDGTQTSEHPKPGVKYRGTSRTAYLPDCEQGRTVLSLLKVAWERRLVFTVGRSATTGRDNVVTWNDIHHKTSLSGGEINFGYPDSTYLSRVMEEMALRGVTEADLH